MKGSVMRAGPARGFALLLGAFALMPTAAAEAKAMQSLYQFAGGSDGNGSVDQLLIDPSGNLYGVTAGNDTVQGTVFKFSPGGTETVLHAFQYQIFQASLPRGGVVMDSDGNLYGEARNGGQILCPDLEALNPDCGSLYKIAPDGTMTTIHAFDGTDGTLPSGGLTMDSAGNFYGTAVMGGSGDACTGGCGTVFKMTPDGATAALYNFTGRSDGAKPAGGLAIDSAGNLYGTTALGGLGRGIVFKITPDGTEAILHAFNGSDGNQPSGGLALDASGNLYGTTATGGSGAGSYGEVYKLATNGTLTVLHTFASGDGVYPTGYLAIDGSGNLFGTTAQGGKGCKSYGCGTAFKIAADGTYTQLAVFKGRVAHNPFDGVVLDNRGNLFGSALGAYSDKQHRGMLFEIKK
jgi:uncharacterized repeat protein (TIGR03803 family)